MRNGTVVASPKSASLGYSLISRRQRSLAAVTHHGVVHLYTVMKMAYTGIVCLPPPSPSPLTPLSVMFDALQVNNILVLYGVEQSDNLLVQYDVSSGACVRVNKTSISCDKLETIKGFAVCIDTVLGDMHMIHLPLGSRPINTIKMNVCITTLSKMTDRFQT